MEFIEQIVEMLPITKSLDDGVRRVEEAARVCYKSENKATENSAQAMVDRLISNKHLAMLEHQPIYLLGKKGKMKKDVVYKYMTNPYSKVLCSVDGYYIIVTNRRVIIENGWEQDVIDFNYSPSDEKLLEWIASGVDVRVTFKITTSLQVVMELLRHRTMSFAMESSRYCNYANGKFGGNLKFVKKNYPKWYLNLAYKAFCKISELTYRFVNRIAKSAQISAIVLPKCTKTELVMTGNLSDWYKFLDLRYFEKTGKVLPDMKVIAENIAVEIESLLESARKSL